MNVFELFASLKLDSSEYEKGLDDAESKAYETGQNIGNGLQKAGKVLAGTAKVASAAISATAGALTPLVKNAVDAYGEQQQLVGGIETMFGDAAQTVLDNSQKAFATAGMSANEYMDTVMSFSASLIQSTGRGEQQDIEQLSANLDEKLKITKRELEDEYAARKQALDEEIKLTKDKGAKEELKKKRDEELTALKRANQDKLDELKRHNDEVIAETEAANMKSVQTPESMQKAAELADIALRDISDNVNKMGSSAESIQNAYSGFAKQNFTMLDNLKLGYGGTKEEMERLLADAEAISGQEFDVSSYADIVEAIHVIQQEMGISGLSAEEAADMVAKGLLTEEEAMQKMGTTAKEAGSTLSGSMAQMKAAWENLNVAIAGGGDMDEAIDNLINSAEGMLNNMLPIVENALSGIAELAGKIAPIIAEKLPVIAEELLPPLLSAATTLVSGLVEALPSILSVLIVQLPSIIDTIVSTILGMLPELVQLGFDLILSLAMGIADSLPTLIPQIVEVILKIVEVLTDPENIMKLLDAAVAIILGIAEGLILAIPKLIPAVINIILNIATALIENIPRLLVSIAQIIVSVIQTILQMGADVVKAVIDVFVNAKDNLMKRIEDAKNWGKDLIDNFIGGIKAKWDAFKETLSNIAQTVKDFLGFSEPKKGPLSNFHTYAPDMMDLFMKGITDNEGELQNTLSSAFNFAPQISGLASSNVASLTQGGYVGSPVGASGSNGANSPVPVNIMLVGDAAKLFEVVREKDYEFYKANGHGGFAYEG